MPTVSVIIPVYNTAKYLEACLTSIQNQTFNDFEAIIVNDGSTDNSCELIAKLVKNDVRFTVIYQENAGLSEARNTGIRHVSSPWITFVDSDDIVAPNYLEVLLQATVKFKDVDIICSWFQSFTDKAPVVSTIPTDTVRVFDPKEALTRALYQDRIPDHSAWNKLYSASLWKSTQFPKGKFFEDLATIPQIFLKAKQIATVNSPLYFYRKHKSSILNSAYSLKKAELLDIAENVYSLVAESSCDKALLQAAQNTLISASYSILKRCPDTEEFSELQDRAWNHIKELRLGNLLDKNVRPRNKAANIMSFAGRNLLTRMLRMLP